MRTETMRAPALDEQALEQLEAEFLSGPIDFLISRSGARLPDAELLAGTASGLAEHDQQMRTLYRTKPGGKCCD
jgi:hypothetical protein